MLQRIFLAVLATTAVLSDVAAEEEKFIVTPPNITYAAIGSDVLLNWTYTAPAGVTPLITNWYQADAAGNKDGKYIMSLVSGGNPLVQKESFIGRAEYRPNAGLFIKNISLTDESYMVCSVQFSNGHDHKDQRFLQVTIAPSVTNLFQPEIIVMVDTISVLSCRFEARPVPAVKWLLNDVEMKDSRYNINTTIVGIFQSSYHVVSILTINVTQPEDMGKIQCVGLLPNGNVNSSTDHIVYYAPRGTNFTTNYASNIGELGLVTIFTCKANGNPTISYELYKEGTLLLNSTTGVFKINSTATTDKGKYSCNPVNYLGAGPRMAINFTVHVSPRLQTYSGSAIKTLLDTSLTLYCTYYGEPTPNINWTKTGGLVSSSATISVSVISKNSSFAVVNSTLQFAKVKKSDFGTYNCFAQNSVGSLSKNISVDVQYSPELNKSLNHNYTLLEEPHKNNSWTCLANGNPGLIVTWHVNGGAVGEGYVVHEKAKDLGNRHQTESTITMVGITRNKSSSLSCNVSNDLGNSSSLAYIIINYIPTSTNKMPANLNVTLNNSMTLSCEVNAQPAPLIYWEKDGSRLNGSKYNMKNHVLVSTMYSEKIQSNLSIPTAKKEDFGSFKCVAMNSVGNLTQTTNLNVHFKPELLTSLSATSQVLEGSLNHTLECFVTSNPMAFITWTKNGSVIHLSNETIISVSNNITERSSTTKSKITFKRIGKYHYGNYSCVAANMIGAASSEQLLIVTYNPYVVASSPSVVYINASNTMKLFCDIKSSPATNSIHWLNNRKSINASNHAVSLSSIFASPQHDITKTELTITNASRFDNGMYSCEAKNAIGNLTKNVTLIVYYSPLSTKSVNAEYRRVEGTQFNLSCEFISNPTSNIHWTFNGSTIINASPGYNITTTVNTQMGRVTTNTMLFISNLRREMHGSYECRATNHQGFFKEMATAIVYYEPTFTSPTIPTMHLNTNDSIILTCHVDSNPASNITWLKDNSLLFNNSKTFIRKSLQYIDKFKTIVLSTLRLNFVDKTSSGNYSCKATNDVATKYQQTRVIVKYPPELTHNFGHQQNLTESSVIVRFTCTVESHPISMIHWYKDGLRYTMNINETIKVSTDIKSIIESSLVFPSGINRTDFGIYTCNASNERGNASFATDVTVWYGPEFRSNLTGQLDIMELKNASFECTIEGYPVPVIEWHKNGKKLMHGKYQTTATTVVSTANRIVKKSVISFVKVVENDTAEYTCKGSNVVGMKMQKNRLNVLFLPKLLVPSSNVTANQSNLVNLHCLTNANPPVSKYNWTKDGASLPETGSTYSIASAQHLSTGTYACTPINSLGSSGTLVFKLVVNIPPSFTQQADCKPNRVTKKMVCQCSGTGVPPPSVFWTKQPNTTVIGTGNMYDRDLISKDVDGKYNCHLKNLLKEVISTTGFYHYVNPTTEWASWEACNETCGQGYEFRSRTCNFPPCDEHLVENRTCNVPCTPQKMKQDEAWAIALYVLIPILVVFLAIILLWFARTKKRKDEQTPIVVPVNGNLSKPPSTRSIQTRRNIYLPENTFATMNPGYLEEEKETPRGDDVYIDLETKNYDSIEAELKFDEEYPVDSSTDDITENPTSARSSLDEDVKPTVPDLLINGQIESKEQALELEQQADDEVDTYLGPDNTEVPYSFYNEMSTSL